MLVDRQRDSWHDDNGETRVESRQQLEAKGFCLNLSAGRLRASRHRVSLAPPKRPLFAPRNANQDTRLTRDRVRLGNSHRTHGAVGRGHIPLLRRAKSACMALRAVRYLATIPNQRGREKALSWTAVRPERCFRPAPIARLGEAVPLHLLPNVRCVAMPGENGATRSPVSVLQEKCP